MKFQLLAAVLCCAMSVHAQGALRLAGSTTVQAALEPKHQALEAAVGAPIQLTGSGTATGLVSLLSGAAYIAMLSAPLEDVARGSTSS